MLSKMLISMLFGMSILAPFSYGASSNFIEVSQVEGCKYGTVESSELKTKDGTLLKGYRLTLSECYEISKADSLKLIAKRYLDYPAVLYADGGKERCERRAEELIASIPARSACADAKVLPDDLNFIGFRKLAP